MGAGTRDKRIAIWTKSYTIDPLTGEDLETPVAHSTVWARIEPLKSWEKRDMGKLLTESAHRVEIRRDDTVTSDMTITWGSRTLKIVAHPVPNETLHETIIICEEDNS